jgi:hypothetical protein
MTAQSALLKKTLKPGQPSHVKINRRNLKGEPLLRRDEALELLEPV